MHIPGTSLQRIFIFQHLGASPGAHPATGLHFWLICFTHARLEARDQGHRWRATRRGGGAHRRAHQCCRHSIHPAERREQNPAVVLSRGPSPVCTANAVDDARTCTHHAHRPADRTPRSSSTALAGSCGSRTHLFHLLCQHHARASTPCDAQVLVKLSLAQPEAPSRSTITAVPIIKLFVWGEFVCLLLQYLLQNCSRVGGGKQWRTCATRDYEPRPVWTSLPITHS